MIFLDIETTGLSPHKHELHGVGWLDEQGQTAYERAPTPTLFGGDVVAHNALFDLRFLMHKGVDLSGIKHIHDTRMMAMLIDENGDGGLKELTARYLGPGRLVNKNELDQAIKAEKLHHVGQLCALDLAEGPKQGVYRDLIGRYCLEDLRNTRDLFYCLRDIMHQKARAQKVVLGGRTLLDYYLSEAMPFYRSILQIERTGICVDMQRLEQLRNNLTTQSQQLLDRIVSLWAPHIAALTEREQENELLERIAKFKTWKKVADLINNPSRLRWKFNIGSQVHLNKLLRDHVKISLSGLRRTKTGQRSIDDVALQQLAEFAPTPNDREALKALRTVREVTKHLTVYIGDEKKGVVSYLQPQADGTQRVFPEYSPFPVTGRLSLSNPGLQQLPRQGGLRRLFVPPPGHVFLHADASQVELRIAAHLSRDPALVEAYQEGRDVHKQTAAAMFGVPLDKVTPEQRQAAKSTNFLLIYDGGPQRLSQQIKEQAGLSFSVDECRQFRAAFFDRYRTYRAYLDQQKANMKRYLAVTSEAGRVRRLPDLVYGQYLEWEYDPETDKRVPRFNGPNALVNKLKAELFKYRDRCKTYHEVASLKFSHALKQGYNFPVQSLGATITKLAIMKLQRAGFNVVCTVHDSVDVIERDDSRLAEFTAILSSAYKLRVPLVWDSKVMHSMEE
jgi:DNA polymerase I-like protein with 3'-5' exonuclease and polymerase domains